MTYADLLDALKALSPEQLEQNAVCHVTEDDEEVFHTVCDLGVSVAFFLDSDCEPVTNEEQVVLLVEEGS